MKPRRKWGLAEWVYGYMILFGLSGIGKGVYEGFITQSLDPTIDARRGSHGHRSNVHGPLAILLGCGFIALGVFICWWAAENFRRTRAGKPPIDLSKISRNFRSGGEDDAGR